MKQNTHLANALLIRSLRDRAKAKGYSKTDFRKRAGGIPATFENIVTGKHNPRLHHFLSVVEALGGQIKIEWHD